MTTVVNVWLAEHPLPGYLDPIKKLAAGFEAAHPGYRIEVTGYGFRELPAEVARAAGQGRPRTSPSTTPPRPGSPWTRGGRRASRCSCRSSGPSPAAARSSASASSSATWSPPYAATTPTRASWPPRR
ncbi:hypothetical protein ACFQQB_66685 [Nonomuraea rubra]|uniref:hypothetical protein n=1 Tax=Nonomuraea rubra TaxID=46180 RepID=UPI003610CB8B